MPKVKDIPFSEVIKCMNPEYPSNCNWRGMEYNSKRWDKKLRNQQIEILSTLSAGRKDFICGSILFESEVISNNTKVYLCNHMIEEFD